MFRSIIIATVILLADCVGTTATACGAPPAGQVYIVRQPAPVVQLFRRGARAIAWPFRPQYYVAVPQQNTTSYRSY